MREIPVLPHRWPFRFVDVTVERADPGAAHAGFGGVVLARVTANGRAAAGAEWGSTVLLAEALAQAAFAVAPASGATEERAFLAGIQNFEAVRPPVAGETLRIEVRMVAGFGAVARFDGEIRTGQETLARGSILVHRSAAPGR